MVSIKTGLSLALLAGGVALFFGLGGASGIGARIGGGFATFGASLVGALNPFASQGGNQPAPQETNAPTTAGEELTGKSPDIGLPLLESNLTKTKGAFDDLNRFFENLFSGSLFNPNAFATASSFTPEAIRLRIEAAPERAGTLFGGHESAIAQESALQLAIIQSKADFPEFFR